MRDRNQFSIHIQRIESLAFRPARDFGVKTFSGLDQRCKYSHRPAFRYCFNCFGNGGEALFLHGQIAVRAKLRSGFCKKQPEKMVNLRHCSDGRFPSSACNPLLNRHTGRQSADQIDIGLFELLDELPCIRRHAVEKTSLSLREQNIKCKRGFAGATQTGNDHHLLSWDFDIDVFQVVFPRTVDLNCAVASVNSKSWCLLSGARQFRSVILSEVEGSRRTTLSISPRDLSTSLRSARDDVLQEFPSV